jgi:hypothetical protein
MSDYCVVVSRKTRGAWSEVISALLQKHADKSPRVVEYEVLMDSLEGLRPAARYTVFIATPAECSRSFVRTVHHITRSIDPTHPYSDTIWGILCAASLVDALRIACTTDPLTIHSVFAGTHEGSELDMFESGVAYDELIEGRVWRKQVGRAPEQGSYEGDETVHLARDLNTACADMIITSGHARERCWYVQIHSVLNICIYIYILLCALFFHS